MVDVPKGVVENLTKKSDVEKAVETIANVPSLTMLIEQGTLSVRARADLESGEPLKGRSLEQHLTIAADAQQQVFAKFKGSIAAVEENKNLSDHGKQQVREQVAADAAKELDEMPKASLFRNIQSQAAKARADHQLRVDAERPAPSGDLEAVHARIGICAHFLALGDGLKRREALVAAADRGDIAVLDAIDGGHAMTHGVRAEDIEFCRKRFVKSRLATETASLERSLHGVTVMQNAFPIIRKAIQKVARIKNQPKQVENLTESMRAEHRKRLGL